MVINITILKKIIQVFKKKILKNYNYFFKGYFRSVRSQKFRYRCSIFYKCSKVLIEIKFKKIQLTFKNSPMKYD